MPASMIIGIYGERSRSSRKAREFRADLGVDSWRQRTDMTGFRYRGSIAVNFVQGRMGA
jgi:hypothetical protein